MKEKEMEKKMSGIEAISDDELEAVAGGAAASGITPEQAEAQAKADGRTIPFNKNDSAPSNVVCPCPIEYKWARSDRLFLITFPQPQPGYSDMKCYKCGKMLNGIIVK
ncbi:MAG TPA: hypothetical protein DEB31_01500 [Clostridiales bacterium]|nr:hypothetical protein [Clostridiales bacterium]